MIRIIVLTMLLPGCSRSTIEPNMAYQPNETTTYLAQDIYDNFISPKTSGKIKLDEGVPYLRVSTNTKILIPEGRVFITVRRQNYGIEVFRAADPIIKRKYWDVIINWDNWREIEVLGEGDMFFNNDGILRIGSLTYYDTNFSILKIEVR